MTGTANPSPEGSVAWFIGQCGQALASVWSQTLGSEWKLESPVESAGSQGESLMFKVAGALAGQVAFMVPSEKAIWLACRFTGEEPTAGQSYSPKHRECLEKLFRQVEGQLRPLLRSLAGEVRFELLPAGQPPVADGPCWELPLAADNERIAVAVCLDQQFAAGLNEGSTAAQLPAQPASPAQVERPALPENLNLLLDIELPASLRFGQKQLKLKDVLQLSAGSVIELDQQVQEPVELLVDGRVIARGEVVIVDGNYGLRVTEVVSTGERAKALS